MKHNFPSRINKISQGRLISRIRKRQDGASWGFSSPSSASNCTECRGFRALRWSRLGQYLPLVIIEHRHRLAWILRFIQALAVGKPSRYQPFYFNRLGSDGGHGHFLLWKRHWVWSQQCCLSCSGWTQGNLWRQAWAAAEWACLS